MSESNYVYYYPQPLLDGEPGLTLKDLAGSIGVTVSHYNAKFDKHSFTEDFLPRIKDQGGRYEGVQVSAHRTKRALNKVAVLMFLKEHRHSNEEHMARKEAYIAWLIEEEARRTLAAEAKEMPQVLEEQSLEAKLKKMEEKIRDLTERVSDCALTQTEKEVFKDFYEQKCIKLVISYGLSSKKWKHAEKCVLFEVKTKAKLLFGLDKWYLAPQKKFELMCDIVTAYVPEPKERSEIIKNAEGNPKAAPERSPEEGNTFFGKDGPYN
jgi:hypothetical protein